MSELPSKPNIDLADINAANSELKSEVEKKDEQHALSKNLAARAYMAIAVAETEGTTLLGKHGAGMVDGVSVASHLRHIGESDMADSLDQAQTFSQSADLEEYDAKMATETALTKARDHKNTNLDSYIELSNKTAATDGYDVNTAERQAEQVTKDVQKMARAKKEQKLDSLMEEARKLATADRVEIVTPESIEKLREVKVIEDLKSLELSKDDLRSALDYLVSLKGLVFKKEGSKNVSNEVARILEKYKEVNLEPYQKQSGRWYEDPEYNDRDAQETALHFIKTDLGFLMDYGQVSGSIEADTKDWYKQFGEKYARKVREDQAKNVAKEI